MKFRKLLRLIEVNSIFYEEIINTFPSLLVPTERDIINTYSYGTGEDLNKNNIYFTDEFMIIQEYKFEFIYEKLYHKKYFDKCTSWKQIRLRLNDTIDKPFKKNSGWFCYSYVRQNILRKEYTDEEIDDILNSHQKQKDESLKQFHYTMNINNNVYKIKNCYKYDITKAHASEIIKLFPKCKDRILSLLKKAAEAKKRGDIEKATEYKDYINYFVGFLAYKTKEQKDNNELGKYELTYNYIVQNITTKLFNAMNITGGMLVYSNTDSFCVQNPDNILPESTKIGEFKLEYQGDVYFYQDKNYFIYEFGKDKVGSCRKKVRDQIDLKNGKIVHYDITGTKYIKEIINVCTEKVNVVEL